MSELKPCPFCGEDAEELPERCGISIIRCPSCDIRVYRRSKKEAVTAWNRRPINYELISDIKNVLQEKDRANEYIEVYKSICDGHSRTHKMLMGEVNLLRRWVSWVLRRPPWWMPLDVKRWKREEPPYRKQSYRSQTDWEI